MYLVHSHGCTSDLGCNTISHPHRTHRVYFNSETVSNCPSQNCLTLILKQFVSVKIKKSYLSVKVSRDGITNTIFIICIRCMSNGTYLEMESQTQYQRFVVPSPKRKKIRREVTSRSIRKNTFLHYNTPVLLKTTVR